jgi:hypothetical protein
MKFQHLKIGQQFHYQGETYLKNTPLIASHAETGNQKLIPRYAEIELLDTTDSTIRQTTLQTPDPHQIRATLEQYHELYLLAIRDALPQVDDSIIQSLQAKLDTLHKQLLQQLASEK